MAIGDQILNRASMTSIAIGLCAVASMMRVFGNEKTMVRVVRKGGGVYHPKGDGARIVSFAQYYREASGLNQPRHSIAYFVAKDLAILPVALFAPLFYALVFVAVTTPRAPFSVYYYALVAQ